MSDFVDYFTNPNYIGGYNAILSGNTADNDKGMVYVEDASDVWFWRRLIEQFRPNQYNFSPATHEGKSQQGKTALRKFYDGLNPKILVARDADFDWLLPNAIDDLNNPYILHTFAYSKESVLIEKQDLDKFFREISHTIRHQVEMKDIITLFSQHAYQALCGLVANHLNGKMVALNKLKASLAIIDKSMILDDLAFDKTVFDTIEKNLDELFKESEKNCPQAIEYLTQHGITQDNAYRFISGHLLDEFIKKIHHDLRNQLLAKEFGIVKDNLKGKAVGDRQTQIRKIFATNFQLETYYRQYLIEQADSIHQRILQKIQAIPKY